MKHYPLTTSELKLKKYFKDNLDYQNVIFNIGEVQPLLADIFMSDGSSTGNIFDEDLFIPLDLDCSFIRHLRYLPAFLHAHDFFEIVYVKSGKCHNYIGDECITLLAGDFCLFRLQRETASKNHKKGHRKILHGEYSIAPHQAR